MVKDGWAEQADGTIDVVAYKYLHSLLHNWLLILMLLIGVAGVLYGLSAVLCVVRRVAVSGLRVLAWYS